MRRSLTLLLVLFLNMALNPISYAEPNTAASVYDDSGNYGDSQGYGRVGALDILEFWPTSFFFAR